MFKGRNSVLSLVAAMAVAGLVATPSYASAAVASVTLGPLPIPDVPIELCVNTTCVTTPSLSSATITVSVEASGLTLPVIVAGPCPAGQTGAVLTISSLLPSNLTIGAEISGELLDGEPFELPIGPVPVSLGLGESTTVSLCTST